MTIRNMLLGISIMVAFFGGLVLMTQAAERWSPWSSSGPTATATPTITSTSTHTPTSTPTNTATPTPVPERVIVTWYGEPFRGGLLYCGTDIYGRFDPNDPTTVAKGAGGPPCGSRLRLCSNNACIVAIIKDKCGGCGPGHLDLSRAGWEVLGRPAVVDMTIVTNQPEER